jgi:ribosomal protein L12E/L44/L45/RPP1/RPP2
VMGETGPNGLVSKTVDIAAQMPTLIKALTGVDVTQLIKNVVEKQGEQATSEQEA